MDDVLGNVGRLSYRVCEQWWPQLAWLGPALVTGGFPCPDWSAAGQSRGVRGPHAGLALVAVAAVAASGAPLGLLENVPGLRTRHPAALQALDALDLQAHWAVAATVAESDFV